MVGVTGLEPVTYALSGHRSNQLSYTPLLRPRFARGFEGLTPDCAAAWHFFAASQRVTGPPSRLRRLRRGIFSLREKMEVAGLEPATSSLQSWRSPN
jgi:hypothetical protein